MGGIFSLSSLTSIAMCDVVKVRRVETESDDEANKPRMERVTVSA